MEQRESGDWFPPSTQSQGSKLSVEQPGVDPPASSSPSSERMLQWWALVKKSGVFTTKMPEKDRSRQIKTD